MSRDHSRSQSELMPGGTGKPFLTQSSCGQFCRCPEQWRRRWVDGDVIPPGIAAAKGRALHDAARENMSQKQKTHCDLPVSDIVEIAVTSFEQTTRDGGVRLTPDEQAAKRTTMSHAVDDLHDVAIVHAQSQAPEYQPVIVEQSFELALPGSHNFRGTVDLGARRPTDPCDDNLMLVDFKTSRRRKQQTEADYSIQLTAYAAGLHAITGVDVSRVRLDTIVQTTTRTTREALDSTRTAADFEALANRVNTITAAIQSGVFPPADPSRDWWCSPTWCGYWDTCRYVPHS